MKRRLCTCLCCLLACLLLCPPGLTAGFGEFGIKDEAELGQKFKVLMQSKFPLIKDPVVLSYVQDLLHRIQEVMPAQPFDLEVNVLLDPSINAFAAPAGYVFVNSGLILKMHDEGELAAVIAHELAHVSERHIAQHVQQSKMISIGTLLGVLAGALLGGGSALGEAVSVGSMAGGQAAALKYSRDDEREADQLGLRFLTQAGYHPLQMMHSFQRIQENMRMSGVTTPPAYMLTHPGLNERIGSIQDLASHYQGQQPRLEPNRKSLARIQMLLRTKYNPSPGLSSLLEKQEATLTCLERLGRGILQTRLNRMKKAQALFEQALACQGNDPLWLREIGWFFFQTGDYQQALDFLNRAVQGRDRDYLSRYYRARVLAELGARDQAIADLRRVLTRVPEEAEVHRALGRIVGQHGNHFQGYLHLAYAHLYDRHPDQTARWYQKAKELAQTPEQKAELKEFEQVYQERREVW